MASYLDNIPTFNEYVEQRPVDDMLKAGLYKQQLYEIVTGKQIYYYKKKYQRFTNTFW